MFVVAHAADFLYIAPLLAVFIVLFFMRRDKGHADKPDDENKGHA